MLLHILFEGKLEERAKAGSAFASLEASASSQKFATFGVTWEARSLRCSSLVGLDEKAKPTTALARFPCSECRVQQQHSNGNGPHSTRNWT